MCLSLWFCRILTSSSSGRQRAARVKKEKERSNTNQRHNPGTATSLGCGEEQAMKGLGDFYNGFIVGVQLTVRRHSNGGRGLLSAPAGFKNIFVCISKEADDVPTFAHWKSHFSTVRFNALASLLAPSSGDVRDFRLYPRVTDLIV